MPGYMSIADCPCGYHSSSLSHGIRHTGVCLVVAYAKDRREVISLEKTEAKLQGLEFIQEMLVETKRLHSRTRAAGISTATYLSGSIQYTHARKGQLAPQGSV